MAFWASTELKYSHQQLKWEVPLSLVMLFMRQSAYSKNTAQMTLEDKEMIDNQISGSKTQK